MARAGVYKWSAIDRLCTSALSFGGNIVLARLLDPVDFGLLAMVAIFTAISYDISGCGMSDGLIHKLNPTERDYSTVFIFNSVAGLILGGVMCAVAVPVARFFGHSELRTVMVVLGLCFFVKTLSFTQETRMRKELDIKRMAIARITANAMAVGLGIVLAVRGCGYWALLSTQAFINVFMTVNFIIATRWIPRLEFDVKAFRSFFSYGIHLMLAYVVTKTGSNINTLILGKFYPASTTGIYSQAAKLEEIPYSITESVFNWPFLSVICNECDRDRRRAMADAMHRRLLLLIMFLSGLLLVMAGPGVRFLYGSKWDAAIPVFRLLLVFGLCTSMKYYYQTILKACDHTRLIRNLTAAEVCLQLLLLAAAFRHGIYAIALTQVAASAVMIVIYAARYKSIMSIPAAAVAGQWLRAAAACAATLLLFWPVHTLWSGNVPLFADNILTLAVYISAAALICRLLAPQIFREAVARVFNRHNTPQP